VDRRKEQTVAIFSLNGNRDNSCGQIGREKTGGVRISLRLIFSRWADALERQEHTYVRTTGLVLRDDQPHSFETEFRMRHEHSCATWTQGV